MIPDTQWCLDCDGHGVTVIVVGSHRYVSSCGGCNGTGRNVSGSNRCGPRVTEAAKETCRRKNVYPTRRHAANVLAQLKKRGVAVVGFYQCPVCRQYHMTSVKKRGESRKSDELYRSHAEE